MSKSPAPQLCHSNCEDVSPQPHWNLKMTWSPPSPHSLLRGHTELADASSPLRTFSYRASALYAAVSPQNSLFSKVCFLSCVVSLMFTCCPEKIRQQRQISKEIFFLWNSKKKKKKSLEKYYLRMVPWVLKAC